MDTEAGQLLTEVEKRRAFDDFDQAEKCVRDMVVRNTELPSRIRSEYAAMQIAMSHGNAHQAGEHARRLLSIAGQDMFRTDVE